MWFLWLHFFSAWVCTWKNSPIFLVMTLPTHWWLNFPFLYNPMELIHGHDPWLTSEPPVMRTERTLFRRFSITELLPHFTLSSFWLVDNIHYVNLFLLSTDLHAFLPIFFFVKGILRSDTYLSPPQTKSKIKRRADFSLPEFFILPIGRLSQFAWKTSRRHVTIPRISFLPSSQALNGSCSYPDDDHRLPLSRNQN